MKEKLKKEIKNRKLVCLLEIIAYSVLAFVTLFGIENSLYSLLSDVEIKSNIICDDYLFKDTIYREFVSYGLSVGFSCSFFLYLSFNIFKQILSCFKELIKILKHKEHEENA